MAASLAGLLHCYALTGWTPPANVDRRTVEDSISETLGKAYFISCISTAGRRYGGSCDSDGRCSLYAFGCSDVPGWGHPMLVLRAVMPALLDLQDPYYREGSVKDAVDAVGSVGSLLTASEFGRAISISGNSATINLVTWNEMALRIGSLAAREARSKLVPGGRTGEFYGIGF
ncbi:MAG: hypothetical protein HS115_10920 [Spirochaetales bacterium]|nr:hypothetical protein [Spirochaetales bacterium]